MTGEHAGNGCSWAGFRLLLTFSTAVAGRLAPTAMALGRVGAGRCSEGMDCWECGLFCSKVLKCILATEGGGGGGDADDALPLRW